MEDRELKDREVEIKREIEELFVDDIDKFEKKKKWRKQGQSKPLGMIG